MQPPSNSMLRVREHLRVNWLNWPPLEPVAEANVSACLLPRRNVGTEKQGDESKTKAHPVRHNAPERFPAEGMKRGGQRSILVVDDEENFLTLIKWFLSNRGFDIATTPSAAESLDLVRKRTFDVALLDIRLGEGVDGLSLLESLTERQPGIKVIVMTAYPTVGCIRQAFDKGASRFFTKPVDLKELSETIKSL
jgi:CheY-like chemotaxis protein